MMPITFLANLQTFLTKNGYCFQQVTIKSDCEDDHWYEITIITDRQVLVLRGPDNNLRLSEINDLELTNEQ